MNANLQPTAYGRIFPPRADWLARAPVEPIIEPDLPIVDTHHHVWRNRGRYMLDEVLADTGSGHNVVATVFIDCRFLYRTDGPAELRSIGEVEAVADLAERCEADYPGKTRVAAGIVGYADLTHIIMNHTGMPLGYGLFAGKEREVYAQWRSKLPDIAACANVSMKLGGMMMRLAAYDYNQLPAPPSSE